MLQFGQMKKREFCKNTDIAIFEEKIIAIGKNLSKEVVFPNSKIEVKVIDARTNILLWE